MVLKGKMKKLQRWKLHLKADQNEEEDKTKDDDKNSQQKTEYTTTVTVHRNEFSSQDIVFNPDNFPGFKPKDTLVIKIFSKESKFHNTFRLNISLVMHLKSLKT